jgi:Uma2 family endonuclease
MTFRVIRDRLSAMNAPMRKPLTLESFLAWEDRQPLRHEFDGVRTIAMTGGTEAHALIQVNLAIAVGGRLRGAPCRFAGNDLKIQVAGRIRYPDGFVYCGPFQADRKVIDEPVVIFEMLSESTGSTDLITKNAEYAATPSVRRYVVLAQDAIGGTMFERVGEDWTGRLLSADSLLRMPEIGIEVSMTEFYEGVELAAEDDRRTGLE